MATDIKVVPSTVVIGRHGPMVTRGYTEIAGIRFYNDQVVVNRYGQHVLSPGRRAITGQEGDNNTQGEKP